MKKLLSLTIAIALLCTLIVPGAFAEEKKWTEKRTPDGYVLVTNEGGTTLGYSKKSGIALIEQDGFAFKDLNKDGQLNPYEDWRLPAEERAADLAAMMDVDAMAALFTHGGWMGVSPTVDETSRDWDYIIHGGRGGVTRSSIYDGKTSLAVEWNNSLQAVCEGLDYGIPALISVDPGHVSLTVDDNGVGLAFDPDMAFELGKLQGRMYRALGIVMLLGPQLDLATTPIFMRAGGAYTEDPALNRDLAKAYISGLQSTWAEDGTDLGWGKDSVYCVAKHFAGAGAGEGGRNDHNVPGQYDVFPGDNFEAHLIAFFDGAFNLDSLTKSAGIMTNYAIAYSEDGRYGELVAGAYSHYKTDLLKAFGFDGFIITDWGVVGAGEKCWGVEQYTDAQQWALLMLNGINQVGGSADYAMARQGYDAMVEFVGEEEADRVIRTTTAGTLKLFFNLGIFDNPYRSIDEALDTVWTNEAKTEAVAMQYKTVVMLKNSGNLVHEAVEGEARKTVYIPAKYVPVNVTRDGTIPAYWTYPVDLELAAQYYDVVADKIGEPSGGPDANGDPSYTVDDVIRATPEELASCDMALLFLDAPYTESAVTEDGAYLPPSIQYTEYTATEAREVSISGSILEDGTKENRSYRGNTTGIASNYLDYETLLMAKQNAPETCKIVVFMGVSRPIMWNEVEPLCDVIFAYPQKSLSGLAYDWFQKSVLLDILSGKVETTGLLNIQQPIDMAAAENQLEDVPRDVECYVDADGNVYDFAFGLNWSGKIEDERVAKYSVEPLTKCENFEFFLAK